MRMSKISVNSTKERKCVRVEIAKINIHKPLQKPSEQIEVNAIGKPYDYSPDNLP